MRLREITFPVQPHRHLTSENSKLAKDEDNEFDSSGDLAMGRRGLKESIGAALSIFFWRNSLVEESGLLPPRLSNQSQQATPNEHPYPGRPRSGLFASFTGDFLPTDQILHDMPKGPASRRAQYERDDRSLGEHQGWITSDILERIEKRSQDTATQGRGINHDTKQVPLVFRFAAHDWMIHRVNGRVNKDQADRKINSRLPMSNPCQQEAENRTITNGVIAGRVGRTGCDPSGS